MAPELTHYDWRGGREAMLRFGPADGPVVVVALPLFEEANRTRALVSMVLRLLAQRGISGAMPDLPGQGDSLLSTVDARFEHWRAAFAAAAFHAGSQPYVWSLRGGALVDGEADAIARHHFAPEAGRNLIRDLMRMRRASALATGERLVADDVEQPGPPILLGGNLLNRDLLRALIAAQPSSADRTIELFPYLGSADRLLAPHEAPNAEGDLPRFRKPWTASEPFTEPALATVLADDIAAWISSCAA